MRVRGGLSRALKNLLNFKPNNKNSGAATPLCCDPAFIRNFRKYLKNSPNNASQTYIWLHLTAFRVFFKAIPPYLPPFMILMIRFTLAANIVTAPCIRMASIP